MTLDDDALGALADRHGTPLYVYDLDAIDERLARARAALPGARLLYAVKANPNPALLAALLPRMDGADVASEGELFAARSAGARYATLAGPAKTDRALAARADVVVVESIAELDRLPDGQAVMVRLSPAERVRGFAVSTSGGPTPFGVDAEALPALADALHRHRGRLDYRGIHAHAGSQCPSAKAYLEHVRALLGLAARLALEHDLAPRAVCFGGGWGIAQRPGDRELDVGVLGAGLARALDEWSSRTGAPPPTPSFELGRWLVGPCGVYVASVVSTKRSRGVHFTILDGGLHHLLSATDAFGADRPRPPARGLARDRARTETTTLVGPLCTPLDVIGRDVALPEPRPGDRVVLSGVGAYGLSFSPTAFLSHASPIEVLWSHPTRA